MATVASAFIFIGKLPDLRLRLLTLPGWRVSIVQLARVGSSSSRSNFETAVRQNLPEDNE